MRVDRSAFSVPLHKIATNIQQPTAVKNEKMVTNGMESRRPHKFKTPSLPPLWTSHDVVWRCAPSGSVGITSLTVIVREYLTFLQRHSNYFFRTISHRRYILNIDIEGKGNFFGQNCAYDSPETLVSSILEEMVARRLAVLFALVPRHSVVRGLRSSATSLGAASLSSQEAGKKKVLVPIADGMSFNI